MKAALRSTRKARKLRARIAATRCPIWPGITHQWEELPDPTAHGVGNTVRRCAKCLLPDRWTR